MDDRSFKILEYDIVKAGVREFCVSNLGKALCDALAPSDDARRVEIMQQETTEARLLARGGSQPISGLHDVTEPLILAEKGQVLAPKDLLRIADTLRGASKFKKLMRGKRGEAPLISSYAESIADLPDLIEAIDISVDGERVSDSASDDLRRTRRAIKQAESRLQQRLQSIMASSSLRDALSEGFVTQKNGRYVIPVKASHKNKVPGSVIAASSSGQTVFVEPAAVQNLVNELVSLRAKEEELVYRVLCELTGLVVENMRAIKVTVETMAACDFALAKGRHSLDAGGASPVLAKGPVMRLAGAKHPLLGKAAVPVDVTVGGPYRTLVVTGPNTGGKTVLLKTIGLFALMAQSGLHVPAHSAEMPLFTEVLADIGDNQSIQQSLSTFSSHMGAIAGILKVAGSGSLVLLDEIGTGTDPQEGAALACNILDYLHEAGCVTVATSHYGDVKLFAESRRGFLNGCVAFDEETLRPLYKLEIGRSGKSQGIVVAERLGIPPSIIEGAREMAGRGAPSPVFATMDGATRAGFLPQRGLAPGDTGEVSRIAPPDTVRPVAVPRPEPPVEKKETPRDKQFLLGDLVYVTSINEKGRVAKEADDKGDVIVLVRDKRLNVNHKRLRMLGKREDLYPDLPNYDLRIVLTSKEDRKLDNAMAKRPVEGVRVIPTDEKK